MSKIAPIFKSTAHIPRTTQKNILCTFGNHTPNRPVWLRASNSETIAFSWLGSQTSHSTRVWSPSHATAAQCAEEGGSVGQTRENDGQILLKWTTSQGLYASNPACTHSAHISACTLWYSPWALCFNIAKNCTYTLNTYTQEGMEQARRRQPWGGLTQMHDGFGSTPSVMARGRNRAPYAPFIWPQKAFREKRKRGGWWAYVF